MARTANTKTTTQTPTPVENKKKAAAPSKNAVVSKEVTPPAEAPKPEVEVEESGGKFRDIMLDFNSRLQQLTVQANSLKSEFKNIEKLMNKELKTMHKNSKLRKKSTTRSPSGFVKPTPISEELATFLNKEKGSQMARTDVTREINAYIRAHNLQDKQNGRKIIPDPKLAKLLKLDSKDELTYFNLQKYMSPHFHKESKTEATA